MGTILKKSNTQILVENAEILKKMYLSEKRSTTEIGKMSESIFGKKMDAAAIYLGLKKLRIPLRSKSESVSMAMCTLDQSKSFMSEEMVEWIDGFLLGDGSIDCGKRDKNRKAKTARFIMGSTQKEWTEYSMSFFSPYEVSAPQQYGKKREKAPNLSWASRTRFHKDIWHQYERWYPDNGLKKIPHDVRITPKSLLLWYLGDGSITRYGDSSYVVRLATCSFDKDDISSILLPKLEKMGLKATITNDKNDVKFSTDSIKNFFEIIGTQSPISCYNYKFEYNPWLNYYRLSQIVRNNQEKWRVGYLFKTGQLDCIKIPGKKLILFNEDQRDKLVNILDSHKSHGKYLAQDDENDLKAGYENNQGIGEINTHPYAISDVVKNSKERWQARYLISHDLVEHKNGKLTEDGKNKLREKLDFYDGKQIVPQKDIDRFFRIYRENGFPYYDLNFDKFSDYLSKIGQDNGTLNWDGYGSEAASFFHPHIFECKRFKKLSPIEFFNSDEDFKRGIKKALCLYSKITDSKIREICRNEQSSSRINNFPPRVVVKILNKIGGKNLKLLDPCHGFSGRLIGAFCSGRVSEYVGIDLSTETHLGGVKACEWIERYCEEKSVPKMKSELIHGDCIVEMKKFTNQDIILTSPPFLNVEIYKGVNFETDYKKWRKEFVAPFLENCFSSLRNGGHLVLYLEKIANCTFLEDVCDICKNLGFKNMNDLKFSMSFGENNRGKASKRAVPILIFQK